MWAAVNPRDIRRSWLSLLPRLLVLVIGAQQAVAGRAQPYTSAVLAEQGLDGGPAATVRASALAGVASDGRGLDGLLYRPVVAALTAIGAGAGVDRSLAGGAATLDMLVRTQVADAGRTADQVALTAHPRATGYVRMVVGKTCARCLILAGKWYGYNAGFRRHPRCDCIHIPGREDTAGDLRTDPGKAFSAMGRAEQDRVFGKAGAEAIRLGSDLISVVNARRGMYTAGGRQYTRAAATRRRRRLMPEQIFREAKDRDDAVRLLRLHGFLT